MKITIVHADVKVEYEDGERSGVQYSGHPQYSNENPPLEVIQSLGELVKLLKDEKVELLKDEKAKENG